MIKKVLDIGLQKKVLDFMEFWKWLQKRWQQVDLPPLDKCSQYGLQCFFETAATSVVEGTKLEDSAVLKDWLKKQVTTLEEFDEVVKKQKESTRESIRNLRT